MNIIRNVDSGSRYSNFCHPEWFRYKFAEMSDDLDEYIRRHISRPYHPPPCALSPLYKGIWIAYNPAFNRL